MLPLWSFNSEVHIFNSKVHKSLSLVDDCNWHTNLMQKRSVLLKKGLLHVNLLQTLYTYIHIFDIYTNKHGKLVVGKTKTDF